MFKEIKQGCDALVEELDKVLKSMAADATRRAEERALTEKANTAVLRNLKRSHQVNIPK